MAEKDLGLAVRCNLDLPSVEELRVKTTFGLPVTYRLVSIPIYLIKHLEKISDEVIGGDGRLSVPSKTKGDRPPTGNNG